VWDGKAAAGLGGTADVVKHALKHKKQVLHIRSRSFVSEN
jgi:hypothetical protein